MIGKYESLICAQDGTQRSLISGISIWHKTTEPVYASPVGERLHLSDSGQCWGQLTRRALSLFLPLLCS